MGDWNKGREGVGVGGNSKTKQSEGEEGGGWLFGTQE